MKATDACCPRCGGSRVYRDPRFDASYCSICYFRWTWTPSGISTMQRAFMPASGKNAEATLTLFPKTPDDHDIIDRLLKALDLRDSPDACIACGGSSLSSKGYACIPCHGTGTQGIHEIIGATIVYEMKSLCICGSRHFEYIGIGREQNCYACHKCGKKYRSVKGVFESLPMSNTEMAAALDAKREAPVPLQEVKEATQPIDTFCEILKEAEIYAAAAGFGRDSQEAIRDAARFAQAASKPEKAVRTPVVVKTPPAASQGPSASKPLKVRVNVKPRK